MPLSGTPRVTIVGATGAVGVEMLELLAQRDFPASSVKLLASPRSAGREMTYRDDTLVVEALTDEAFNDIDLALFSAGGEVSRTFAPRAIAAGATVIDNSSAFRMDDDVPLIVPEINGKVLDRWDGPGVIANPNCSTIIALMAVTPIHHAVGVERMVVATYQSASGGGAAMMAELEQQARDFAAGDPLTTDIVGRPYLFNVFSHNSPVGPDGANEEERKLVQETRKIWNQPDARVTGTCVRVPVLRAHCEAINLTLGGPLNADEARSILDVAPGVCVVDNPMANRFPEPILASGKDDVLVGRIRADDSQAPGRGLSLFVAGDQLRKGAALNAIQIAERLLPG